MIKTILCTALAVIAAGGVFAGPPKAKKAAALPESGLVETYEPETALVNPPAVVFDVKNAAALQALTASVDGERPSNAILHVDGQGNVAGGDSLESVLGKIEGKVIPVLAVKDAGGADFVSGFLKEREGVLDLAVLSEDPALVKKMRESAIGARGIVEYPKACDDYEYVAVTNENLANVSILPQAEVTGERVFYIQSRFKTVWVRAEHSDRVSLMGAVTSGAYGVVTEDFKALYDIIEEMKGLARMPFNVAHRGLPQICHENSVSGTREAIARGATHVELDGMLTTDGHIVMMHDNDVARTAEGTGNIEGMTLSQAKSHLLDLVEPKEEIPTLEEIIDVMKGTDAVLVFEVKSKGTDIVPVLKRILQEKEFFDQCVVIAFSEDAIKRVHEELPQVPVADLNSYTSANLGEKLLTLGRYNCTLSTSGEKSARFNQMLRDRGIIGWYWTFANASDVDGAVAMGLMGLTNNEGDYFGAKEENYRFVEGIPSAEKNAPKKGDSVYVYTVRYNGDTAQDFGTVEEVVDRGSYYDVIASYTAGERTYYTALYRIDKAGGCAGVLTGGGISLAVLLLASALLRKRT